MRRWGDGSGCSSCWSLELSEQPVTGTVTVTRMALALSLPIAVEVNAL